MNYEDLPVGTVLLKPDSGAVFVRTDETWVIVCRDGRTGPVRAELLLPGLIELVEKPGIQPPVEPERTHDREGLEWVRRGHLYHLPSCPDNCPLGVRYAALVRHYGPLAEPPAADAYPAGACPGCGSPNMGNCSAHLSNCPSFQALEAAEAAGGDGRG